MIAGVLWFGLAILFVDFDVGGYTDLIPVLAFVAIGLGLVGSRLTPHRRAILAGAVVVIVFVNVFSFGTLGLVFPAADTPAPTPMDELRTNDRALQLGNVPDDTHDVRYYYWQKETPETCHYRLSLLEVNWLELTGDRLSSPCSDLREIQTVLE